MENDIYDLLILGGGCAGLTAGIYAGRAKLKAAVVEKQGAGGQAAITDEIANYPGFKKISGTELAERMLGAGYFLWNRIYPAGCSEPEAYPGD